MADVLVFPTKPVTSDGSAPAPRSTEARITSGDLRHGVLLSCRRCAWLQWAPIRQKCPQCGNLTVVLVEQELDYTRA